MTGQRFDHYRIVEHIGEGGMGAVYRAIDETLGREVAIKLLRPELATRQDIVERFHMEAHTLAKLNHPNIATLYGLTRKASNCFMVMEYVRGETLEQVLKRVGRLPWNVAVRIGRQVLAALAYAHGLHVVHRDVKPSNLMVDGEGRVKVMDFGLARVLGSDRSTRVGHIVGTLEYMSPEQIRGQEVDGRADLYALAMVLYELLTGRIPFKSTSDYALMTAHLEQAPPPLRTALADVPEWLDRAVAVGLSKRPEDRHATAQAFRDALGTGSVDVEAVRLGLAAPLRILVDDPTDPVPLGLVESVSHRAGPPTRLAGAHLDGPHVKATRLAEASGAAAPDRSRSSWRAFATGWHLRLLGAGLASLALIAIAVWMALLPEAAAPVASTPATPRAPAPTPPPVASTVPAASVAPTPAPMAREPVPVMTPPPVAREVDREAAPPRARGVLPEIDKSPAPPATVPEPPPVATALLPAAPEVTRAATLAPRTFEKVNMIIWDEDEPEELEVLVTLQADRIVVRDADSQRLVKSIAYSNIESALYSSKDPQLEAGPGVAIGKVFRAPVNLFRRGPRHWLKVSTSSEPLYFRLDKQSVDAILPAFEQHTGIAISKAGR